jgi:PTH1 family peptidyl-tRNA hydrolase
VTEGLLSRLRRLVSTPTEASQEPGDERHVRIVVGLGNPGSEYAGNRHNVGFWTVNRLARKHGIELDASSQASVGRGEIGGRTVVLAKPRTFVNRSGEAVWNLVKRYEIDDASELLVVFDELDLPVGKVRLRPKGGHGGYKGLQSIIEAVRSDQFPRLRIGIGRPVVNGEPSRDPEIVAGYVLSDPPPDERELLDQAVERAVQAIETAIADGVERAMSRYNT